ncbi:annexin B9 isoform X3 [Copidosoma floridanum]|uniref:annexin B9 isoform X3 n=1 Tax=Copidosoma floridanum TaxID=29053 RepID=UPI000C6F6189|nr:annexin B9 isoform X3 [Copidosoma floridanum]
MSGEDLRFHMCQPTVYPADPFEPEEDAKTLREAMKGFGTDETAIIDVLAHRGIMQRLAIADKYKAMFGKDLISDLKGELGGNFENAIVAMMTPLPEFYAKELNDAISGIGTDEEIIIEILASLRNIQIVADVYRDKYGNDLESDIMSDTSGHFQRLLVSLLSGGRSTDLGVDEAEATNDAEQLIAAGEGCWGTDESVFNSILVTRSFSQLRKVFDEYERISGTDIEDVIKSEFSGSLQEGYIAVVRCVRNRSVYFAKKLKHAMSGMGTNEKTLIRIIVARSEIDLGDIKEAYPSIADGRQLADDIADDCDGEMKRLLTALVY